MRSFSTCAQILRRLQRKIGVYVARSWIDVNEDLGKWMIFDYKTSDAPENPKAAHRKKSGEWFSNERLPPGMRAGRGA